MLSLSFSLSTFGNSAGVVSMNQIALVSLITLVVVLVFIALRLYQHLQRLRARYSPILKIDAELNRTTEHSST
jgi:hypothetical protein